MELSSHGHRKRIECLRAVEGEQGNAVTVNLPSEGLVIGACVVALARLRHHHLLTGRSNCDPVAIGPT